MRARSWLVTGTVIGSTLLPGGASGALEGRYLGTYQLYEGTKNDDTMRHLLDLHTGDDLSRNINLRLDLSLAYRSRPGEPQTDLFQSRIFGDLRSPLWRAHAQFVPWQEAAPGANPPRQREIQLGMELTPRRAPHLQLIYDRHDRDNVFGRSGSEDFRVEGTHTLGTVGSHLSYRRINTLTQGGIGAPSNTDEWRGGVGGTRSWGSLAGNAAYEAEQSTFQTRDRERRYYTQRVDVGGSWAPLRRLRLGGSAFTRWGKSEDNAPHGNRPIDEAFLSGSLDFLPVPELDLQAVREYRSTEGLTGKDISDYLKLQAVFRKDLLRGLLFQNGYVYVVDLHNQGGSIPQDAVYFLLDGRVRRGVTMRGELRFTRSGDTEQNSGTFVRRLLGVRLTPSRQLRLEETWYRNTYPELFIDPLGDSLPATRLDAQVDQEWETLIGYRPFGPLDLTASYRWLDGQGRVERDERYGTFTGSYRFADRSTLTANWNRRVSKLGLSQADNSALSMDLSFWLPREIRAKVTWTRNTVGHLPAASWYNLTIEKRF